MCWKLDPAFDDTALRGAFGPTWSWPRVLLLSNLVVEQDWLSGASFAGADDYRSPLIGVDAALTLETLGAEEPLRARIDGARATLRIQRLQGRTTSTEAQVSLAVGEKLQRIWLGLYSDAFYTAEHTPISEAAFGGSWDLSGGTALVGHPLGAVRSAHAVASTARLDVTVVGTFELGLRASALVGETTLRHGFALVVNALLEGIALSAGLASPQGDILRGDAATLAVYASANAAVFLP